MKITIKTVHQKVFQVYFLHTPPADLSSVYFAYQIDAEGSDTVAKLKDRIQQSHDHPVANQKLIYAG
jgi:UV excision repair protein RAD23